MEPSRNVSSKVISNRIKLSKGIKIHGTRLDFVSMLYVCNTSAVHIKIIIPRRQLLSQAENALLIFDYYQ